MANPTGFLEFSRENIGHKDPRERVKDFEEFLTPLSEEQRREQAGRCMDCGVPFCHSDYGCPIHNLIPEWNDLIYHGKWEEAFYRLMKTNNFPEYTGRVCPAPCEHACVLAINEPAVSIKDNEYTIIDWAYNNGLMKPRPPTHRTGKKIAIIGSGPAGLSAADQLNHAGHNVVVFEREDRIGGLLMYGIPNMKLDKGLVERRNVLMAEEGVEFRTNSHVGVNVDPEKLLYEFDALLLTVGSTRPRDLPIEGRSLKGVHFAMDFLKENTKNLLSQEKSSEGFFSAKGKNVLSWGGCSSSSKLRIPEH